MCGHHNETVGVCHQRLLAFGASLTSDLTLVSPANGRPDLASELLLVPRVGVIHREGENSGPTQKSRAVSTTPRDIVLQS